LAGGWEKLYTEELYNDCNKDRQVKREGLGDSSSTYREMVECVQNFNLKKPEGKRIIWDVFFWGCDAVSLLLGPAD